MVFRVAAGEGELVAYLTTDAEQRASPEDAPLVQPVTVEPVEPDTTRTSFAQGKKLLWGTTGAGVVAAVLIACYMLGAFESPSDRKHDGPGSVPPTPAAEATTQGADPDADVQRCIVAASRWVSDGALKDAPALTEDLQRVLASNLDPSDRKALEKLSAEVRERRSRLIADAEYQEARQQVARRAYSEAERTLTEYLRNSHGTQRTEASALLGSVRLATSDPHVDRFLSSLSDRDFTSLRRSGKLPSRLLPREEHLAIAMRERVRRRLPTENARREAAKAPVARKSPPKPKPSLTRKRYKGLPAEATQVRFLPDGKRALLALLDGSVLLWDIAAWKAVQTFTGHKGRIHDLAVCSDGQRFATAGEDKTARVWSVETGKALQRLIGHDSAVRSVAFVPGGKQLATGAHDDLRFWSLASERETKKIRVSRLQTSTSILEADVMALKFFDKGKRLLIVAVKPMKGFLSSRTEYYLCHIYVMDGRSGKATTMKIRRGQIIGAVVTPAQRCLTYEPDRLCLWRTSNWIEIKETKASKYRIRDVAHARDGSSLAVACTDKRIRIVETDTLAVLAEYSDHQSPPSAVALSPDGHHALSAGAGELLFWQLPKRTARPFRAKGDCLAVLEGHPSAVSHVGFFADGKQVISSGSYFGNSASGHALRVWDIGSRKEVRSIAVLDVAARDDRSFNENCRQITPDGRFALYYSGTSRLYQYVDIVRGRSMQRPSAGLPSKIGGRNHGGVFECAASPDGQLVAFAVRGEGAMKNATGFYYWSPLKNRPAGKHVGHAQLTQLITRGYERQRSAALSAMALGTRGPTVLFASYADPKLLYVWTGNSLRDLRGHTSQINGIGVTRDGKYAVTGGDDEVVFWWDLTRKRRVHELSEHKDNVLSVAVSPNGKTAASGDSSGVVVLWDTAKGQALKTFREHTMEIRCLAFSPDGRFIASGSRDKTIRIWKVPAGR